MSLPSKYTDRLITEAQYLAERMCERVAKRDKRSLPYKFWDNEDWSKIFIFQVVKANQLLKKYSLEIILRALAKPRAFSIYSLGNLSLLKPFLNQAEKEIQNSQNTDVLEVNADIIHQQPQKQLPKKNLIQELD